MPLFRKVLRVSNRSMLAFIFFFSFSSSCLYFIYVAPGIGEPARWGGRGGGPQGPPLYPWWCAGPGALLLTPHLCCAAFRRSRRFIWRRDVGSAIPACQARKVR